MVNREPSDILNISSKSESSEVTSKDIAVDQLLNQRERLKQLIELIEADLHSLGYREEDEET